MLLEAPFVLLLAALLWAGLCLHVRISLRATLILALLSFFLAGAADAHHLALDPLLTIAQALCAIGLLGMGALLLKGDMVSWLATATGALAAMLLGLMAGHGHLAETAGAIILFTPLLVAVHGARTWLREKLGRRTILVRVEPGALPIDRVNQLLGVDTHNIARYDVVKTVDGMDAVRLRFTGLSPAMTAEILSKLEKLPGATVVEEASEFDRAIRFLAPDFEPDMA